MLVLTGLLTEPPRSLYPPPQGLGQRANCQLVADDGRNWLLVDPTGLLVQAAGQRVAVSGWTDGHGLLVTGAGPAPTVTSASSPNAASAGPGAASVGPFAAAAGPAGPSVLTGVVTPVVAASEPGAIGSGHRGLLPPGGIAQPGFLAQPRHQLTGQHGTVWLLAPHADLDGLSGNVIEAEGWLIHPQRILAAAVIRILPVAVSA